MKQKFTYLFFFLPAALLLSLAGCHKAPVAEAGGTAEIGIRPSSAGMSKATFYSTDNITTVDLKIFAYLHDTETAFIDGDKYHYIPEFSDWRFYQGASIVHHYWPIPGSYWNSTEMDGHLDFVGYLPYDLSNTGVTLDSYTAGNPAFHADLSEVSYATQEEFLYAYVDDQTAAGGEVEMEFHHPFAKISLQLKTSHRAVYNLNTIKFKNIKNNGTFTHANNPQWVASGGNTDLTITVDDGISADADFTSTQVTSMSLPLIVLPQSLTTADQIEVKLTWNNGDSETTYTFDNPVGEWQSGKSYTYTLDLLGEIKFSVIIDNWSSEETPRNIRF